MDVKWTSLPSGWRLPGHAHAGRRASRESVKKIATAGGRRRSRYWREQQLNAQVRVETRSPAPHGHVAPARSQPQTSESDHAKQQPGIDTVAVLRSRRRRCSRAGARGLVLEITSPIAGPGCCAIWGKRRRRRCSRGGAPSVREQPDCRAEGRGFESISRTSAAHQRASREPRSWRVFVARSSRRPSPPPDPSGG